MWGRWSCRVLKIFFNSKIREGIKLSDVKNLVKDFDKYCDKLETQFNTNTVPLIRCPKTHCGCGLCVPKSREDKVAKSIFNYHAPGIQPEFMQMKDNQNKSSLKKEVLEFDEANGNETI